MGLILHTLLEDRIHAYDAVGISIIGSTSGSQGTSPNIG